MSSNSRKIISWRLERLSEHEQSVINQWADQQDNIQQSITNLVMHAINRFGPTVDIMNFDIQKALHAEGLATGVTVPVANQQSNLTAEVEVKATNL